jgi:hypothetical protein
VILDLATKCGIGGGTKTNINVNYKITVSSSSFEFRKVINPVLQLGIRILLVTISPVISNQFNFPCPLQASDISVRLPSAVPLLQLLIMLDRNSLMGTNLNDSWLSSSGSLGISYVMDALTDSGAVESLVYSNSIFDPVLICGMYLLSLI